MFNDSSSFYVCPGGDLTNSVQRQRTRDTTSSDTPLWAAADDRFFWNKFMLQDLISQKVI